MPGETELDLEMGKKGFVKYTNVDKSGSSVRNSKENTLIAKLSSNNIAFVIRSDVNAPAGYNTLYVRQEQLETVKKLFSGS